MRTSPVAVMTIADATKVIAGGNFTCANRASNVFCWGSNANGQLGTGNTTSSVVPVRAGSLASGLDIAAGAAHSCTVTGAAGAFHMVACWGDNALGQVGNATATTPIVMPVATNPSFTDWSQAVAGGAHTCGRRGANVFCWGNNANGQLGIGSIVMQRGPVQVTAITNVVDLTAGRSHTCALLTEGSVSCWGANASGQLGDGTTTQRLLPVPVPGLTDAIAIAAGDVHTCALRATGAVVCWGANTSGQLGNGTNAPRLTPTPVTGLSAGVVEITAGAAHTCARRADHQVLCWGANASGQLGDGTTVARAVPTQVQGLY
jgi:alpha-tubulin suppressor-like RCC1 family protein